MDQMNIQDDQESAYAGLTQEELKHEIRDLEQECRRLGINVSQAVVGDGPFLF